MAKDFQRLINHLRAMELPVIGEANSSWGSGAPGHRDKIRLDAQTELIRAGETEVSDLTDLAKIPRPHSWSLSITHAQNLGAWIAVKRPMRIGLDIEVAARIRPAILERVCSSHEIAAAPRPEFLWSAKEAYFKALENEQPAAITELEISGWAAQESGVFAFKGAKSAPADGIACFAPPYIYAVCLVRRESN